MPFFPTWLAALRNGALALFLSATLAGCVTSSRAPVQRHLPPLPAYANEVSVADPKAGEDPLAVAARERAGRKQANKIIGNLSDWYLGVRTSFGDAR